MEKENIAKQNQKTIDEIARLAEKAVADSPVYKHHAVIMDVDSINAEIVVTKQKLHNLNKMKHDLLKKL